MFLLGFIEQNRNYAKAGTSLTVIILRDQCLVHWAKNHRFRFALVERMTYCRCLLFARAMAPQWEMVVPKTSKSILAAAALVAAMGVNIPASHAAGWRHEPWCAVFEYDDVTWDCSYRTFEECYPNVIGGIRGSCNPSPDGPGASVAAPAEAHKQRKHRAQQ
jgi:hypothetical protein